MMEENKIDKGSKIGKNLIMGFNNIIYSNVIIGDNVEIGNFCIIYPGTIIGDNSILRNYVELRENTIVGKNVYIDSRVSTSGSCKIGNDVVLRYDTIIARGVEVGDASYLCPRVMTNNLAKDQRAIGGASIGKNCFIGTNAVLQYGIEIGNNVVIGSMSFVNKDCLADQIYIGIPAKVLGKNK